MGIKIAQKLKREIPKKKFRKLRFGGCYEKSILRYLWKRN